MDSWKKSLLKIVKDNIIAPDLGNVWLAVLWSMLQVWMPAHFLCSDAICWPPGIIPLPVLWLCPSPGLIPSALRRACFAILLCENHSYGNTSARPETSAMQSPGLFSEIPLGLQQPQQHAGGLLGHSNFSHQRHSYNDALCSLQGLCKMHCCTFFLLLAGQAGMEGTKICSTSVFSSSTTHHWKLKAYSSCQGEIRIYFYLAH